MIDDNVIKRKSTILETIECMYSYNYLPEECFIVCFCNEVENKNAHF